MVEMGIFRTTIGIESSSQRGQIKELTDTMVDTGNEFTWIPRNVLDSLGIKSERRRSFILADGRKIERDIGYAIVHAGALRPRTSSSSRRPMTSFCLGYDRSRD
jgi:predicted aspartyl protease